MTLFGAPGVAFAIGMGLILTGFSLAPIYPLLMTVTRGRVGPMLADHAIGTQVSAATLGIILFPMLAGGIAERMGFSMDQRGHDSARADSFPADS